MLKAGEIGILADDLTGACDVAASFTPGAGTVRVSVRPPTALAQTGGLTVINTQSRSMSARQCKQLLSGVGRQLNRKRVIFNKIDSALRGSVGAQIEGLVEALRPRKVVLAPALPRLGRTTCGGIQYDGGVPIDETDHAQDPVSPIRSADIRKLVAETGRAKCEIPDVQTDDELSRIVREAISYDRVVLVGSLGLADALAAEVEESGAKPADAVAGGHCVIVCGSAYRRAQKQIQQAVSKGGVRVVDWPEEDVSGIGKQPVEIDQLLLIRLTQKPPPGRSFAREAARVISEFEPGGVGIIGGDTAYQLLRELGVDNLAICGRMAEVIAYGVIADGEIAGCRFTTKGGSVGPDDAVMQMFEYLKESKGRCR